MLVTSWRHHHRRRCQAALERILPHLFFSFPLCRRCHCIRSDVVIISCHSGNEGDEGDEHIQTHAYNPVPKHDVVYRDVILARCAYIFPPSISSSSAHSFRPNFFCSFEIRHQRRVAPVSPACNTLHLTHSPLSTGGSHTFRRFLSHAATNTRADDDPGLVAC